MDTNQDLGGRYRLRERLGAGGMSVVWRAEDRVLGRDVAVKLLGPAFAETARDRVRAEARAVARLAHPHIAAVYDYSEAPGGEDGRPVPYVVMELVAGPSLAQRLAAGPLPWRDAVAVTAEVADALVAAHEAGVVHRDITPANVLLGRNGVKVVDFGIAAAVGEREASTLLGTPAYLAPERLEGHGAQPATDVYALGLLLYQALTGSLPWPADTTTGMLQAHRYTPPAPLPPVPGLPDEVAALVRACLAKDPADRPSAAEVSRRLGALAGSGMTRMIAAGGVPDGGTAAGAAAAGLAATRAIPRGTSAFPAGVAAVPTRTPAGYGPAHGDEPPYGYGPPPGRPRRRGVLVPVLAVVALLAIALAGIALFAGNHGGGAPAAGSSAASTAPTKTAGTPSRAAQVACSVDVAGSGDKGGDTTLTLTNTGPDALSGWTLTFQSGGKIDGGSPGDWSQDGDQVTVRSQDGLGAGQSVTLQATGGGHGRHGARLGGFALNGVGCSGGGDTGNGNGQGDGG